MNDRSRPRAGSPATGAGGTGRKTPLPRGSAARPAVMPEPYRYTIGDLEDRTGVGSRTIRYYIQEGLLPPAHGRGPSATYDTSHLLRLQAIESLKQQRLSLAEIRERLLGLTDAGIAGLMRIAVGPDPEQDLWRRIILHEDLELQVRVQRNGRAGDAIEAFVDRVIELAHGELPEE